MIEISQEEFEQKVQEVIDGKLSRQQLTKLLKTDTRTLNNKIQELVVYNSDLYMEFIKKFPYKSKERNDIDYEALVIEIVKTSMTTSAAVEKYNIGERTITRKVKALEKENPYLIEIYREVKKNNRNNVVETKDLKEKIDRLVSRPVKISELNEIRKKELEELEKTFNSRCQYVSKEEAARSMGLTANRMYKMLNELYRIRIEENTKKNNEGNSTFKDSLKVSSIPTTKVTTSEENNSGEKVIDGKGIGED